MLKNKVVVVTGGGSGIGRAASIIFAAAGARVLVADLSDEGGNATVAQVIEAGGSAIFEQTDVSNEASVQKMVARAVTCFGRLDGAFNNAGIGRKADKLLPDMSSADFDDVCNVNQRGVFLCMKYQIAAMRETGGGAIVNNSSGLGQVAMPFAAEYVASKHAILGLTRAGAAEAGKTGVRVNAVAPGPVDTELLNRFTGSAERKAGLVAGVPAKRAGKPEEIAQTIVFLASDKVDYLTGQIIGVNGGKTAS